MRISILKEERKARDTQAFINRVNAIISAVFGTLCLLILAGLI